MLTLKKEDCSGCFACYSICPKKAISMEEDNEGFLYPKIDKNLCINCELCTKVCPINNKRDDSYIRKSFVARDTRKDILKLGTSGSVFTSLMEYFLNNNGVVYGSIVDDDNIVKHIRIDSFDDCRMKKIPGSKYVRSYIGESFSQVKNDLEQDKIVLFSGTPCQVSGLKNYIGKDNANLYLVDFVCRGNPSPMFLKKYVDFQEKKYKSRIIEIRFRNKTYGYHSSTMKLSFENGKTYYGSPRTDIYLKSFFSDLCSRPSCYDCKHKGIKHNSDLTLFDSWHAKEVASNIIDDDYGFTNVIVQSEKGHRLLSLLNTIELHDSDLEKCISYDGIMLRESVKIPEKRSEFLKSLNELSVSLDKYVKRYVSISLKDILIEKSKKIYYMRKYRRFK